MRRWKWICVSFSLLVNNHFPPTQLLVALVKLEVLVGDCICQMLQFFVCLYVWNLVSIAFIYYGTQSDFRVKCYCRSYLLRASVLNFDRVDILRDSIGLSSEKLLSLEFSQSFCFQF